MIVCDLEDFFEEEIAPPLIDNDGDVHLFENDLKYCDDSGETITKCGNDSDSGLLLSARRCTVSYVRMAATDKFSFEDKKGLT